MSDPAVPRRPSPASAPGRNPNPTSPQPPPPPAPAAKLAVAELREEGELSSGGDEPEASRAHSFAPSNIAKAVEGIQISPANFLGKRNNRLSNANACAQKPGGPSYRNNLRMKQGQFKGSTNRNLCWQKSASSDNLVISFSDDESGSDSGMSKQEGSKDQKGSAEEAYKMPVVIPQNRIAREQIPQKMGQVAKCGSANCSTVTSQLRNSGATTRGPGASVSRREPHIQRQIAPIKPSNSQKDQNGSSLNLADSNLENLRHKIAIKESELKVQKRSMILGLDKNADLCTDQSRMRMEKLSSGAANGGHATLSTPVEPDGRPVKRLKPDQQRSNNQISVGQLEVPVPRESSMRKNNMKSAERGTIGNRSMVNSNVSETEMHLVTTEPTSQREYNGASKNTLSSEAQHKVVPDSGKPAEYTGKQAMAEDTSSLVPVTVDRTGVSVAMPSVHIDTSMLSNRSSLVASGVENQNLLNCGDQGRGQRSTTLSTLLELEELQEKELEEAQSYRHRCEVEEREALKAYRKAQRALIEANERCAILHRKRELFSAGLHGLIAENSSFMWSSNIENPDVSHDKLSVLNYRIPAEPWMLDKLSGKPNNPCPDEAPQQPTDRHESMLDHWGERAVSTVDPKYVSNVNDACGPVNHFNVPPDESNVNDACGPVNRFNMPPDDTEENLHFATTESRLERPSNSENHMEETTHVVLEDKGQTLVDAAVDYNLLEASLRSRLVEKFGKRTLSKNSEGGIIEGTVGEAAENEHNETSATLIPQLQEAEATFATNTEGTMEPERDVADLGAKLDGQSNLSSGTYSGSSDTAINPGDNICSLKESCLPSCLNHYNLPSSAPLNAARHIKQVFPGFCIEVSGCKEDWLTNDTTCEVAPSMLGVIQDHSEENTRTSSQTSQKDNDMLACGIDPFWPFCMFELRGKCNDEECPWQHIEHYAWRKSKQTKHPITPVAGRSACSLFQHILPVPTYNIGLNLIKADADLVQSVFASSIWQYWQRGFCASFPLPLSVQRLLPSDAPFLQAGAGSIADFDRKRQLFYFQSLSGKKKTTGLVESEQLLEVALDLYYGKVNKPERLKALVFLAQAVETIPNSVVLWVFYLHLYYQKDEGLEEDDMFSLAVQHNMYSYELWLMYINSRLRFEDRLDAYNDALSMLCQMKADTDKELKDKSAFILDIFLQMIYFLCMSDAADRAISRILGIVRTSIAADDTGDKLLTDVLCCLSMSDKCIFWVCCIYVSIYRDLPQAIIDQLDLQKDLPSELIWPVVELRIDNRDQAIELLKYAVDKMVSDINESIHDGDLRLLHFLAVSHINCVAALKGLQSCAELLVKYLEKYPTCTEILVISARLEGKYDICLGLRGFDELLRNWPSEQGIQYFWNQYAEHALANKNIDLAEKLMTCWFEKYGEVSMRSAAVDGEEGSDEKQLHSAEQPLPVSSVGNSPSKSEDQVIWFLNLSLYRILQNNLHGAQFAVDEALRLASGKHYKHCLREHAAIHNLEKSSSNFHCQIVLDLVGGYLADHRTLPIKEILSRRYCQNIKKRKVRQLIDDILGAASADFSVINSILEVWYGPTLLPEKFDQLKDFVDFVESVMEFLPANYQLALSVGRFVVRHFTYGDATSQGLGFWASSILVNAIFRAVPVAPEFVWLEGAHLLEKLQVVEVAERFLQQATSVYPFSFKLWHVYLNASRTSRNTESIVEAARLRGIELNLTPT